jgi:lipid II:glycine glycyltransferase (peptidoglycan interpeptide bridge formation enzyme)
MLNIVIPAQRLKVASVHERWFFAAPEADGPSLATYYHCAATQEIPGFFRKPKFTFLLDLKQPEEKIVEGFVKNTRYEVRRAAKDGVTVAVETSQEEFSNFFDGFAHEKNRDEIDERELDFYWPHMRVTKATLGDQTLVMHSYLLDRDSGRACLLHSASQFRGADSAMRSLVGRANRFLHLQDMLALAKDGFTTYDFGGCSPQTDDPELSKINDFKAGFGGKLVEESTYTSNALVMLQKVKRALARS